MPEPRPRIPGKPAAKISTCSRKKGMELQKVATKAAMRSARLRLSIACAFTRRIDSTLFPVRSSVLVSAEPRSAVNKTGTNNPFSRCGLPVQRWASPCSVCRASSIAATLTVLSRTHQTSASGVAANCNLATSALSTARSQAERHLRGELCRRK